MRRFEDGSYQSTGGVARYGAQPLNPADRPAKDVAYFGSQTAMKRAAQPEEIAPA